METTVGQRRALTALEFGLQIRSHGYNLFVVGAPGSGRTTTAQAHVQQQAARQAPPDDWCYVHNFDDPYRPRALRFPSGSAPAFAAAMQTLVERCRTEIPRAFESEPYQQRQQQIGSDLEHRRAAILEDLEREANRHGFTIRAGPTGMMTIPLVQGHPATAEEFEALSDADRRAIQQQGEALHDAVTTAWRQIHELERRAADRFQALTRETGLLAVGNLVDEVIERYKQHGPAAAYLERVRTDIVEHLDVFRPHAEGSQAGPTDGPPPPGDDPFARYRVNVLVTASGDKGAPVVFERNPTYHNLVGRVDYRPSFGTMSTDFRMIKPGALHRANGGYLMLSARDVLLNPMAWEALKRALDGREIAIENLGDALSTMPTVTVRPEPIPLAVKIVLIGTPLVHDMLHRADEEFRKLFKVKVEFDREMERTPENVTLYAGFIRARVEAEGLLPFDRTGIARVVEYGSRLVEHQGKLSTQFEEVGDLVAEASHWAEQAGSKLVGAAHVQQALARGEYRLSMARDKLQEAMLEGVIAVQTDGSAAGRLNGLSVLQTGDYVFGVPSRISARVAPGSDGVVDIERESEMSGRTHSKGVLILSAYLTGKYAQETPLSLTASLTFEQLYSEVDGDSASGAELCCLLSALADAPLDQGIAMTGSVDQYGNMQAIGGAQYKIEGFFDTCAARGLTGRQGVILPAANLRHLMLRDDVIDAVRAGRFHVYAVTHIEECLELLTGLPAGTLGPDGTYPEGTINQRIQRRLEHYADRVREFGGGTPPAVREGRPVQ